MNDSRSAWQVEVFATLEEAQEFARASKENLDKRLLERAERKIKKQALDKLNNS